ncbi:MAG: 2-oxoglutarate dehydrogenase complex dihydrolipoyllysine-residue succinyltransferase [Pseudomonadota bacterium]
MVEIRVPALGESVTEATIGQWLKKEGDSVSADEPVVELETDKVSVEVPAPAAGVLSKIAAKEGDTADLDALLGEIGEANGAAPAPSNGASAPAPAPAAASSAGGQQVDIVVPSSGESVTEADIGEWLVKVGDVVKVDDPLVTLETDKAAVDLPAPVSGTVVELKANEGDTVSVGDVIGVMAEGEGAAAAAPKPAPAASAAPAPAPSTDAPLSPAPRRIIEQNNLDSSAIAGTGKGGRITKGDALEALSQVGTAAAKPAQARPSAPKELGEREERVKMSRLRQTIARRLKESQEIAAQLTTFNDVDMTGVMDARKQYKELFEKKHGVKLGFMSFFVKACIQALREVPEVNAEIDGTDIIYKNHYDVGIAVGTDKGLVVPVLRDADVKSIAQIEKEIADFGRRARDGDLKLEEMQGGTFTITNGGVYGSLMSTPILNMPQSGILGMHRIEKRPIVMGDEVKVRPMMYLALSYDHRIVDGKGAVTFLVRVKENLEDPQRLLLDL